MPPLPGALLVRRVRARAEGLTKKPWNPAVDLSEDQLARSYRGIDGRPWPEELSLSIPRDGGLLGIEHWASLDAMAASQTNGNVYDAVILATGSSVELSSVAFLGFDVGFYNDEYSVFSSIYHEAIHGPQLELRRYASRLNESLLFSTSADADSFRELRDDLRRRGRDVEHDDCYAIAVFGNDRRTTVLLVRVSAHDVSTGAIHPKPRAAARSRKISTTWQGCATKLPRASNKP